MAVFGAVGMQTSWAIDNTSEYIGSLRVTDTGPTVVLLGITLAGLGALHRFRGRRWRKEFCVKGQSGRFSQ